MRIPNALLATSLMLTAAPAFAVPETQTAPAGTETTRYCLRVEAITGSHVETVQCWTRAEWADQGVDVDKAWAADGVRVIG